MWTFDAETVKRIVFLTTGFAGGTAKKRLELKSLKGETKAEELRPRWPDLPSALVWASRFFKLSRFSGKIPAK